MGKAFISWQQRWYVLAVSCIYVQRERAMRDRDRDRQTDRDAYIHTHTHTHMHTHNERASMHRTMEMSLRRVGGKALRRWKFASIARAWAGWCEHSQTQVLVYLGMNACMCMCARMCVRVCVCVCVCERERERERGGERGGRRGCRAHKFVSKEGVGCRM